MRILPFLAALLLSSTAFAQQVVNPCTKTSGGCTPVSASNPLPVTAIGGVTVSLGTSAAATNPRRSGEAGTGLYTAGAGKVDVAASGSNIAEFLSTGLNLASGKTYQIDGSQIAVGNLANIAANTIVGNNTGSAAAPAAQTSFSISGSGTATQFTASGTGANTLPVGSTAQRPTAAAGMVRYNSTIPAVEFPSFVSGGLWATIGMNATTTNGSGTYTSYPFPERSSTFIGQYAGYQATENSTCSGDNTGVGHRALQGLTSNACYYANNDFSQGGTCVQNTALGSYNMTGMTCSSVTANSFSGSGNVGVGFSVLNALNPTTGAINADRNIAVGENVGNNIRYGRFNTLVCNDCFGNGTSNDGTNNTIVGAQSALSVTNTSYTTVVGSNALNANTTGANNTSLGAYTLNANTTGSNNVAVGGLAGLANTTGSNNLTLGYGVGSQTLATGSNNVLIGTSNAVDAASSSTSNQLNIQNSITGTMAGGSNPSICTVGQVCILGQLRSANFNTTNDQAITIGPLTSGNINYLSSATKYKITAILVTNCSAALSSAQGAFYTAASKGGTIIGATTTAYTSCTSATTSQYLQALTNQDTNIFTAATLYLSLTTAQGASRTADVYILGVPFN